MPAGSTESWGVSGSSRVQTWHPSGVVRNSSRFGASVNPASVPLFVQPFICTMFGANYDAAYIGGEMTNAKVAPARIQPSERTLAVATASCSNSIRRVPSAQWTTVMNMHIPVVVSNALGSSLQVTSRLLSYS